MGGDVFPFPCKPPPNAMPVFTGTVTLPVYEKESKWIWYAVFSFVCLHDDGRRRVINIH